MATSPDHPDLVFVQAEGYTKGRPDGPPLWIVVHDMEVSETATRAEGTALYFADPPDGRRVSSHYTCDSDSVVQCVLLKDSAWTVGNREGNNRGINWEFAGFASQTRAQWLDDFGRAMFSQAAPYIRADAQRFGIPLQRRTVAELREFRPGVTSHNDLRLAFGGTTTHTDPGSNFPWDYFMALIQEEDDMSLTTKQDAWLYNASSVVGNLALFNESAPTRNDRGEPSSLEIVLVKRIKALEAKVDELSLVLTPGQLEVIAAAAESGAEKGVDDALDGATVTTTIDTAGE